MEVHVPMVMSQAAIDALMAQNADPGDENAEALDEMADEAQAAPQPQPEAQPEDEAPLGGVLTEEERAAVEAAAQVDAPAPVGPGAQVEPEVIEADGVRLRKWSANSTTSNDKINDRVQELEDKLRQIEAAGLGAASSGSADPHELTEIKRAIEQLTTSIQTLWSSLQQLTEQSQGSLGFAAKQTFDCPECGSHGTISVPVSCTSCGYESEWGFYPEQPQQ